MRVKWSRNLDVPAQQRGQTSSTRDSNKDDKRKGFLNIFKFRDRKNEDERKKEDETQTQPPKEGFEGKTRKTVTFADQQSPGTSVVCNRKGRRVSTDAVDMTVFKVSKNELPNKPQTSRTSNERSPLFKRTENEDSTLPERKQSDVERNQTESKLPKSVTVGKPSPSRGLTDVGNRSDALASRPFETALRSVSQKSSRSKVDLSRTLEKGDVCSDEEQKHASKIPVLVSKESFHVAKDVFKSDFWSNNIEVTAKTQTPSSSKLGLESVNSDRNNSARKDSFQTVGRKEEEKTVDELLRSKIPVSESVPCKDGKIKADGNGNEKLHHQICLAEVAIPHDLSAENNKHAPIKTPSYSPVGYCGSKLVFPKVGVYDNASLFGTSNFRKDTRFQSVGVKRFESKEPLCQNKLPLKNDTTTDRRDIKPKEAVSSRQIVSENKSDCPTPEDVGASNEVVDSDDIVSAPVESESDQVTSSPTVPTVKTSDTVKENIREKTPLDIEISKEGKEVPGEEEVIVADVEIEKNRALATTSINNENSDKEVPVKENNSLSTLCLQPTNNGFSCLNEIILTKEVKDKILIASDAPIPVKSGIENMRNLLDASIIIVNHRELSSKPWICNIFTPRELKPSCMENRSVCDKDRFGKTDGTTSASYEDKANVGDIVFIPKNLFVESKRTFVESVEIPEDSESEESADLEEKLDDARDKIIEQEVIFQEAESNQEVGQNALGSLLEYDSVAFIDEQVDTAEEEVSSDGDKEKQSDFSSVLTSSTAIANTHDNVPECRKEASEGTLSYQQALPETRSVENLTGGGDKYEVSISCPQDPEAVVVVASLNDVTTTPNDLPTSKPDVDERGKDAECDEIPIEGALPKTEDSKVDRLPSPLNTSELHSAPVDDDELRRSPSASEDNCDVVPLRKYDSIEFIDDVTDEGSSVGRCGLSSSTSCSADGQQRTPQSGDLFKTDPKTSQSPAIGKYGGGTQTQAPPAWSTRVELQQEIQRLGTLCEARTKELNHMKMNFRHASLGFDAFVVLFQYLTDEMDAFSHPHLMLELEKTHTALEDAEAHLHQYQKEFEEIKAKHSEELCKLEKELSQSHQETIENLNLNQSAEIEELRQCHDKQLAELAESHMKQCQEMEEKHSSDLLELKNEHSLQIEELKIFHADQIEAIENSHHETRMELNNQLKELEQQCKDLKHQAKLVEEALQRDTDTKIQWISAKKADLEKEVDSLKTVLDMRRTEIHTLRKENLEMKKELEKLPIAKEKIKMLEAKAEDLQALVNEKIQIERQLSTDHQNLKESYEKESKVNTRLSMENEELMWRLKQNAEASMLLSSISGTSDSAEKSLSPLKSPARQSVSLPMFFHSMENNAADTDRMSLPVSSSNVATCKKLPPLSRKCSSPIRTPSFVAASPPGPCSRRCKMDLKAVISPRKQKHKSHSSEKKYPSKEANSTPSDAELLQPSQFQSDENCEYIKDSSPSSINGTSSDGSQPDCLAEMDHNGVLFNDPLDRSNGSSNEEMCSREVEDSDASLNFEHYDMLITNQILSRKYKALTHLKKGTEFTDKLDSFISCSNSETHSPGNFQNMATATEESTSSKDFTFDDQHFAEIQPREHSSLYSDHSFHRKSDSWNVSFYSPAGELPEGSLPHSGCDNSSQSHVEPENSSILTKKNSLSNNTAFQR